MARIHFKTDTDRTIRNRTDFLKELELVEGERATRWMPESWRNIWSAQALLFSTLTEL